MSGAASARALLKAYGWVAWGAAVLFFSAAPPGWILGVAPHSSWSVLSGLGHVVESGVFTGLLAWSGAKWTRGRTGWLRIACAALAFGLVVELVQLPIPYRSFDLRDLAADAAGIAGALALLRPWARGAARGRPG